MSKQYLATSLEPIVAAQRGIKRLNLTTINLVSTAAILGVVSWGSFEEGWPQALAILMPVLWSAASNRWLAGLVVMTYSIAASRGLIIGISNFFDTSLSIATAVWLSSGVFSFAAGAFCWHPNQRKRAFLIPILLLALILPPAGIVGWANPLTAAGWIFPSLGWFGLLLTVFLSVLLSFKSPLHRLYYSILPLLCISFLASSPIKIPSGWQGYNTHYQFGAGKEQRYDPVKELQRHWALQTSVDSSKAHTHLFPETVGGKWNGFASDEWARFLAEKPSGQTVILGAVINNKSEGYSNVLVRVDATGSEVIYKQRSPMPIGMWTPWNNKGATAHWLNTGIVKIEESKAGVLVCNEALLVWPVLMSVYEKADFLISIGSTWWAPRSIHLSQRHAMQAWAQLFSLPLVEAYNL